MCEFIKLMNREVYITYSQNRCPNIDITNINAFIFVFQIKLYIFHVHALSFIIIIMVAVWC